MVLEEDCIIYQLVHFKSIVWKSNEFSYNLDCNYFICEPFILWFRNSFKFPSWLCVDCNNKFFKTSLTTHDGLTWLAYWLVFCFECYMYLTPALSWYTPCVILYWVCLQINYQCVWYNKKVDNLQGIVFVVVPASLVKGNRS